MLWPVVVIGVIAVPALPVAYAVVHGLRTGRLSHSDTRSFVRRDRHPVRFWLLMLFFLSLLAMYVWVVGRVVTNSLS